MSFEAEIAFYCNIKSSSLAESISRREGGAPRGEWHNIAAVGVGDKGSKV